MLRNATECVQKYIEGLKTRPTKDVIPNAILEIEEANRNHYPSILNDQYTMPSNIRVPDLLKCKYGDRRACYVAGCPINSKKIVSTRINAIVLFAKNVNKDRFASRKKKIPTRDISNLPHKPNKIKWPLPFN